MTAATLLYALSAVLFVAYAALDGFDLGVGALLLFFRGDDDRSAALSAIGPVWNGNEVWLIAAVGSLLAAFPPVYAALLSGLYVPAILFLLCIVVRDVALEFRARMPSPSLRLMCEILFSTASAIAAFLVGFAAGNVVRGLPLDAGHSVVKSAAALVNLNAVTSGLLSAALFALHGAGWLLVKTEGSVRERTVKVYPAVFGAFAGLAILSFLLSFFKTPELMPWKSGRFPVWAFAALDVLCIDLCFHSLRGKRYFACFLASSAITLFTVAWIASAQFPVLIPSLPDAANSLTTANASAGEASLVTLLILAAVGVPIAVGVNVLLYTVFRGKAVHGGEGY